MTFRRPATLLAAPGRHWGDGSQGAPPGGLFVVGPGGGVTEYVDDLEIRSPRWSPGGSEIAFLGRPVASGNTSDNGWALYILDLESRASRRVKPLEGYARSVAWSSSGNSLLVQPGRHLPLEVVDPESGQTRRRTAVGGEYLLLGRSMGDWRPLVQGEASWVVDAELKRAPRLVSRDRAVSRLYHQTVHAWRLRSRSSSLLLWWPGPQNLSDTLSHGVDTRSGLRSMALRSGGSCGMTTRPTVSDFWAGNPAMPGRSVCRIRRDKLLMKRDWPGCWHRRTERASPSFWDRTPIHHVGQ